MNTSPENEHEILRNNLDKFMQVLKRNRENVPLDILKTKYRAGYTKLTEDLKQAASAYASLIACKGIRIHKDYAEEGIALVENTIHSSGICKQLSHVISHTYDIVEFESLALSLRERILSDLEPFYWKHCALYVTRECLENPDILPEYYSLANRCIWKEGKWIPLEEFQKIEQNEK